MCSSSTSRKRDCGIERRNVRASSGTCRAIRVKWSTSTPRFEAGTTSMLPLRIGRCPASLLSGDLHHELTQLADHMRHNAASSSRQRLRRRRASSVHVVAHGCVLSCVQSERAVRSAWVMDCAAGVKTRHANRLAAKRLLNTCLWIFLCVASRASLCVITHLIKLQARTLAIQNPRGITS